MKTKKLVEFASKSLLFIWLDANNQFWIYQSLVSFFLNNNRSYQKCRYSLNLIFSFKLEGVQGTTDYLTGGKLVSIAISDLISYISWSSNGVNQIFIFLISLINLFLFFLNLTKEIYLYEGIYFLNKEGE